VEWEQDEGGRGERDQCRWCGSFRRMKHLPICGNCGCNNRLLEAMKIIYLSCQIVFWCWEGHFCLVDCIFLNVKVKVMWLGLGRELQSVAAWLLKMNDFVCNFLHGKKMILYLRDTCPYITEFRFHPFSSRQGRPQIFGGPI
jgi:hypothetical protein